MKNLNSTTVLIGSILIGLLLFGGLIFYLRSNSTEEQITLPVTLEEFADFQCPACALYHPLISQVKTEFSEDELNFQFRHLPLTQIHEYAYGAALASEAAREQGKFDEYSTLLFENQDKLTDDDLVTYAEELELDIDKFNIDRASEEIKNRVEADIAVADDRGYNSTPTFVLNGKRVSFGNDPETQLRDDIQELIDKAREQESITN